MGSDKNPMLISISLLITNIETESSVTMAFKIFQKIKITREDANQKQKQNN